VSGQRVIACGLPVIASKGPETAAPITASLAQRSWLAQRRYFSWHAIAARYAEFMRGEKYERGLGSGGRS